MCKLSFLLWKCSILLGVVAHICNSSSLGGQGRRISWGQFESSLDNIPKPSVSVCFHAADILKTGNKKRFNRTYSSTWLGRPQNHGRRWFILILHSGSKRKMRKKQKWKPLINPSDLMRLIHYHENSTGKTSRHDSITSSWVPPTTYRNSGKYNSSWDLGRDIAKLYHPLSTKNV